MALRRFRGAAAPFLACGALTAAGLPVDAQAQGRAAGRDTTVEITAGKEYAAGGLHRFFLGDTYRDLWATPIRVPVFNLRSYAGGLTPTRRGGGNQTKSVRFTTADGSEYVFRLVAKQNTSYPKEFKGSIIESISKDQISAHHPVAAVIVPPMLDAVGILHVRPVLGVMPDDPLLGEFREEFAGKLGMMEEYPNKPDHARGFGGSLAVIDSDSLLPLLNRDPRARVDTLKFLAARLMDMFFNDWDRHAGQWKWGQFASGGETVWEPIPRDRDKTFIDYGGIVALAGKFNGYLFTFGTRYPGIRGLTYNSLEFDRRLLSGLEKPVWDAVARSLAARLTDQVIEEAVRRAPVEYQRLLPRLAAILKVRRDSIPWVADRFYRELAEVVDVHASDAAELLRVTRTPGGNLDVELQTLRGAPLFHRRFDPRETHEVRVYLHGGDDRAVVTGTTGGIPLRIIGGNGKNVLVDSSSTGGTHLYDNGTVSGIGYGPDTAFNRRPYLAEYGHPEKPGKDRGSHLTPLLGLTAHGDLGLVTMGGVIKDRYGFRRRPYAQRIGLTGEYASATRGGRVTGWVDQRREESRFHFTATARMSQLEVIRFHGLGNDTPEGLPKFYEVRQEQWLLHPALAWSFGPRSDVSLGPIVTYTTTDSVANRFMAESRPYGFGDFGMAGVRLGVRHDLRDRERDTRRGLVLDLSGTWYPGIWDVKTGFGVLNARAAAYITFPLPLKPLLALRAGARKAFGSFPYQEASYLGGRQTVRTLELGRYAGDAALFGGSELQLSLVRFPLVLPLDVGVFGFAEAGRVYLDGESPGGWHQAAGGGLWVGLVNPATALSLEWANKPGRSAVRLRTGISF